LLRRVTLCPGKRTCRRANAKTALEIIRRIQKTKKPALFRAISQDSTKFCSEQRADSSSAALELFSKAPKESAARAILFKRIQRSAEIRLLFIEDSPQPSRQDLETPSAAKVRLKRFFPAQNSSATLASDFDWHVQCVQAGSLHKTKPIRTNGHEC
jgi:hypothetical protein